MIKVAIYIRYPSDGDGGINLLEQLKDYAINKNEDRISQKFLLIEIVLPKRKNLN